VSFEVAGSAVEQLGRVGLLSEHRRSSRFSEYEMELELALLGVAGEGENGQACRGYPFPRLRARQIRETAEFIYGRENTIRQLLNSAGGVRQARRRLASEMSGIGPKQASLFLRNIGYSDELAVLDVHVLTYMNWVGLISGFITSIRTVEKYEETEEVFLKHARTVGLPAAYLDLAVWVVVRVVKKEHPRWH
jgi:N-glycosylase/DNA lyase